MSTDTKAEILEAANYIAVPDDDLLVVVDLDHDKVQRETERGAGLPLVRICLVWQGRKQFVFVSLNAKGFELSEKHGLELELETPLCTNVLGSYSKHRKVSMGVNPVKQGYPLLPDSKG